MLGRAKSMVRGWVAVPPPAATPYNVACANGHRLRGHRTEGYQALRCPTCGEAVFVLPRSPLPEPPAPAAATRARTARVAADAWAADDAPHALADPPAWPAEPAAVEVGDDVAEVDWVDDPTPAKPEATTPAPRPGVAVKPPAPARPARPQAPPTMPTPAVESAPRPTWREWAVERRNPLLATGLVLVVLGAVAIRRHRQRLEDLPRVAEIGRTEGFRKLDSGDFFAAKKILADASAAVDAMGGRFEGAESIRQAAREAAILTDLVPKSLEELVEEAATYREVAGWSAHFRSMYAGRSVVLETTITAVPDPSKPGSRYEDAYRVLAGRGPKPEPRGRLDFAGFALFEQAQPKVDEVKLVGARLAALEFNLAENTWVFSLEPDSGVFITHAAALEALHWPAGDPVEEAKP